MIVGIGRSCAVVDLLFGAESPAQKSDPDVVEYGIFQRADRLK